MPAPPSGLSVIGMGADSTELGGDMRSFAPAYAAAARLGLRRTCHAGEAVGVSPANIQIALDVLGAERIDHGIAIVEDPQLLRRVAADRVQLTVCPTSNIVIATATTRSLITCSSRYAMRGNGAGAQAT